MMDMLRSGGDSIVRDRMKRCLVLVPAIECDRSSDEACVEDHTSPSAIPVPVAAANSTSAANSGDVGAAESPAREVRLDWDAKPPADVMWTPARDDVEERALSSSLDSMFSCTVPGELEPGRRSETDSKRRSAGSVGTPAVPLPSLPAPAQRQRGQSSGIPVERSVTKRDSTRKVSQSAPTSAPQLPSLSKSSAAKAQKCFDDALGHVSVANMTYTQISSLPDGSPLVERRHGTNRDASRARVLSPHFAISCVADGAALQYWSEVAAQAAVSLFCDNLERILAVHNTATFVSSSRPSTYKSDSPPSVSPRGPPSRASGGARRSAFGSAKPSNNAEHKFLRVKEMEEVLKSAILETNRGMLHYRMPSTGEVVDLAELGGQCTFVASIVCRAFDPSAWSVDRVRRWFPFGRSSTESESDRSGQWHWVCLSVALGDSEAALLHTQSAEPQWHALTEDEGRMLPFVGLRAEQIPPIAKCFVFDGDTVFNWSDGVPQSFVNRVLPSIPPEYVERKSVYSIMSYIVRQTIVSQRRNQLSPDDVAATAIMVKKEASQLPLDRYPYDEDAIDPTALHGSGGSATGASDGE